MPIMKLPHGPNTVWIPFPHEVHRIADIDGGCDLTVSSHHHALGIQIKGHTARQMKRSIQENVDEEVGFLKTQYEKGGKTYAQYYNVKFLEYIEGDKTGKGTHLKFRDTSPAHAVALLHDPAEVAAQLRRIIKRLEQDEELCCVPPAAPEENDAE